MYDIVVIGGGPAGLTAALYAARAGKSVIVLESNAFGGQIATAPRVENFPSVLDINGAELANRMFEQAVAHGVNYDMGNGKVSINDNGFTVTTEYETYECRAVILATGVAHRQLNVDGETRLTGKGVCYCAVCDGAFYRDKKVCVVGDGNSAAQYALYLAGICSHVTLLTMFDRLCCDKELIDRIVVNDKIEWIKSVCVKEILGDSKVEGVVYEGWTVPKNHLDLDAVFVAIGLKPDFKQFVDLVDLDFYGYILTDENCQTSRKGIFAAGDCRSKTVRQCATAVGDGAIAGFNACIYIDSLSGK